MKSKETRGWRQHRYSDGIFVGSEAEARIEKCLAGDVSCECMMRFPLKERDGTVSVGSRAKVKEFEPLYT